LEYVTIKKSVSARSTPSWMSESFSTFDFRFKYWNEKTAKQVENKIPFVPPNRQLEMTVAEFASRVETW
jgi:hypothetical protein